MTKHTPGPWRVDEPEPAEEHPLPHMEVEISTVDDYGHRTIATLNDDNHDWMGNAVAIAALPEVLAVLDEAYQLLYKWEEAD